MGSIIAFDVLTSHPHLIIDTLITAGSPLGIPVIMKKLSKDQSQEKKALPVTPDNILSKWINISDLNDNITLNYNLGDDFLANRFRIRPIDILVDNKYMNEDDRNHHKIYGYLQTNEISNIISDFHTTSIKDLFSTFIKKSSFFFRK